MPLNYMVKKIDRLLRFDTTNDNVVVTLKPFALTPNAPYEIQRTSHGDAHTVTIKVDPSTTDFLLPDGSTSIVLDDATNTAIIRIPADGHSPAFCNTGGGTSGGGTGGPAPAAPNLTAVSTPTVNYSSVGGLPKWSFNGTVTLPSPYIEIRNIHIRIPDLAEVLVIPAAKFGSVEFPLVGLVLSYETELEDLGTAPTYTYTVEYWVENADSVLTSSPPTTTITVNGVPAPFSGAAPFAPVLTSVTATPVYIPYGNLWLFGFTITFTCPASTVSYSVRVTKIDSLGRQSNIDTYPGSPGFPAGSVTFTSTPDDALTIPQAWTIRCTPINPDNVTAAYTDSAPVAVQPATIVSTSAVEFGPRTNITPGDPAGASLRGLLTTVNFTVALANNPGGSSGVQQLVVWIRYDRGDGKGPQTLVVGTRGVTGNGPQTFNIPDTWVTIVLAGTQFDVLLAIWAADPGAMTPPTALTTPGAYDGRFTMAGPSLIPITSASIDSVMYAPIPGGFAWAPHIITVICPFDNANFKAMEVTIQKVSGGFGTALTGLAPDYEGVERTVCGSEASTSAALNITVSFNTVTITSLIAWGTMPPASSAFRRYIIRIKNVRQDDSKVLASCWPGAGGPTDCLYQTDHLEIIPNASNSGLITGALSIAFSGADANVGIAYQGALLATGGAQPYTFSIFSGSLPPLLTLNPATGAISGTPTTAGTYTFVGRVTDGASTTATTPTCTIVVSASGVATGLTLSAVANAITYQNWANAIVPVFSGTVTLPTASANYASLTSIWIYAVSPTGVSVNIQVLSNWGAATTVNFSGWDSSIVCTTVDQTGWSLVFVPTNSSDVAIGGQVTLTDAPPGTPIRIRAQTSTSLNLISSVSVAETGATGTGSAVARYQNPPGGNTYTYVTVTVTYSSTQNTIPVFSVWHSFNGGATKLWFGWFQGKVGTNVQTAILNFFIPLGTGSYQAYVAPGTTLYGDPVPANITTSNTIAMSLGAPSSAPGGAPILSIANIQGTAPTQANIFMGSNSLGNPWAEIIIKCATPANVDTNPYYYELWIAWTDASGNLVSPGGVANFFGWIRAWEFPNDGSVGIFDDKINYPAFDYYLEFRVYARTRNSVGGTPPFAGDPNAVAMQWPGGATFFRLHVGLPPGTPATTVTAGAITPVPTTSSNTNSGLSILSNPSFESSIPGQIMGPFNSSPGPGYMYPGWVVDCQSATSIVTIIGAGGHSGPNLARLTGAATVIKQGFAIAPNLPIYVQFYSQSASPGGGTHQLDVTIFYLSSTLGLIGQTSIGTLTGVYGTWGFTSIIILATSVPAGANLGILAFKSHFAEPSGATWDIDDVVVQQIINQTNSGQDQSLGADTVPVGLHNNQAITTAASYFGLDKVYLLASDNSNVQATVALGSAALSALSGGPPPNGFLFAPTSAGNRLTILHAGASQNGRSFTLRDGNGVDHIVWDGIIVS